MRIQANSPKFTA